MATEHYVDRVENLRLQGPVITLSFVRVQSAEPDQEAPTEEVVKLTMTTQNMVHMTNVLTKALQQGSMTLNDIKKVKIGNADMPKALANQSIDAALTGPPYTTQSINDGHAKVLASDLAPGLMTVAFVGSGKFVNQRADVAERFVLALGQAILQ